MAYPVILIDSATGSDSAASGAGPATALTGTAGATDAAGTTVTLDAGTDLTNVATDGSHAIYLVDTTSDARRWSKITGTAGSGGATPTVTVAHAYAASLSGKSWAIGGRRASIGSASSRLLLEQTNDGVAGDAMPGWTVRMMSGHAETTTSRLDMARNGDLTDGPITLEGEPNAATKPVITFTDNTYCVDAWGNYQVVRGFNAVNSNQGTGFTIGNGLCVDCKATGFSTGFSAATTSVIVGCEADQCAIGIDTPAGSLIVGNYVHDGSSHGIKINGDPWLRGMVEFNIVDSQAGRGIYSDGSSGYDNNRGLFIRNNTVYGCTSHGIEIAAASLTILVVANNVLVGNGGYGLNLSGANLAETQVYFLDRNAYYNNTSGAINPSTNGQTNAVTLTGDPFTNAAGGVFALNNTASAGAACRAAAYPGAFRGGLTTGYLDIGAAQHQDSGGGGPVAARTLVTNIGTY